MSNIFSLSVGLLLTNPKGDLLMIQEPEGWGIPAGKVEAKDILPSRAIRREFIEETNLTTLVGHLTLAGLTLIFKPNHLSLGILYRTSQDIPQRKFTPISEAISFVSQDLIRKPEYNLPALSAWITNSFIISIRREKR